jgi:nitroimidazol reductase NimA-like FMN-containing flavoprotein (pyridoxamine 5'-phosphate oxidase superfamily)
MTADDAVHPGPAVRVLIEPLGAAECWSRLRSTDIGRIGLTVGALPVILPVFFGVVDRSIVFRAEPGTTLAAAATGAVVAFEAGEYPSDRGRGWSVMVQGVAREITPADELAPARALPLRSATGRRHTDALLAVPATTVSGHAITYG